MLRRLRALFRRDVITEEISEELQFHIDARTDEWRRRGVSDAEAKRRAHARGGNVARVRDEGYDVQGGGLMETILMRVGVEMPRPDGTMGQPSRHVNEAMRQ